MKAIVMSGGLGSRLRPLLASPINKHLMPVGDKPLILHPLELLQRSGVRDVLMLLNGDHAELLLETVDTGHTLGLNVFYRYTKETVGGSVGTHLRLAEPWVGDEPFLLMLGDSVYFLERIPEIDTASAPHTWVIPVDHTWDDLEKYAALPRDTSLLQTGLWLFDKSLFKAIDTLAQTEREVRIRHLVDWLDRTTDSLSYTELPARSFIDCGTPAAIDRANAYFASAEKTPRT